MKANQSESEWTLHVHTTARSLIFGMQFKYIYIFKESLQLCDFDNNLFRHKIFNQKYTNRLKKQHACGEICLEMNG